MFKVDLMVFLRPCRFETSKGLGTSLPEFAYLLALLRPPPPSLLLHICISVGEIVV